MWGYVQWLETEWQEVLCVNHGDLYPDVSAVFMRLKPAEEPPGQESERP